MVFVSSPFLKSSSNFPSSSSRKKLLDNFICLGKQGVFVNITWHPFFQARRSLWLATIGERQGLLAGVWILGRGGCWKQLETPPGLHDSSPTSSKGLRRPCELGLEGAAAFPLCAGLGPRPLGLGVREMAVSLFIHSVIHTFIYSFTFSLILSLIQLVFTVWGTALGRDSWQVLVA